MNKHYLNSPEALWNEATKYFNSVDAVNKRSDKRLPYTHTGLAKYIGIKYLTWQANQSDLIAYSDFMEVLHRINLKIHVDQLNGALVGLYEESLLDETYWKWHEARQANFTKA